LLVTDERQLQLAYLRRQNNSLEILATVKEKFEYALMCDLKRIKLYWHELLPYVDVTGYGNGIINRSGVVYDFFREAIWECCRNSNAKDFTYAHEQMANQQEVFNKVRPQSGGIGMPISLDAVFPHTPQAFVPVVETDGN
jgi:hypothetical protein